MRGQADRVEAMFIGSSGAVGGIFTGAAAGDSVYRVIDSLRDAGADKTAEQLMNALMAWSGFNPDA